MITFDILRQKGYHTDINMWETFSIQRDKLNEVFYMTRQEFEAKINAEGLIVVYDEGIKKIYSDYHNVYNDRGEWVKNEINIYGCYEGKANSESAIFITDNERGIPNYIDTFNTVEEAYDALYKKIARLNRIYKSKK
jgi:hypothetical protein